MDQDPSTDHREDTPPAGQRSPEWPPPPDNSTRCCFCVGLTISSLFDLTKGETHPWGSVPYEHHASVEDLEESADSGCDFCQFIIDCLRRVRCYEAFKSIDGEVFLETYWGDDDDDDDYDDLDCGDRSLYQAAQEMDESTQVRLTMDCSMHHNLPSRSMEEKEAFIRENSVCETLLVQVGDLPSIQLNLTVARGETLRFHGYRVGRYRIDPDLGSSTNLGIAKEWLDGCKNNHAACCPAKSSTLPTRVLDVSTQEDLSRCRLVKGGQEGDYVALSHCWGGQASERLTTKTLPAFLSSIEISKLPANFRDAIDMTRRLGIRYLWIDALCIIQDSKEDWETESENMGSIYQNSTLTIFAMMSQGSKEGFLKMANKPQLNPTTLKVFLTSNSQSSVLVTAREIREEDLAMLAYSSPLSKRGWAYQEYLLSCRSLFVGARQLYWGCFTAFDNLEGLYPPVYDHGSGWERVILPDIRSQFTTSDVKIMQRHYYDQVVPEYNTRDLTCPEDKLPAFSGLARRFHHVFGGEYLAGLWSADFHRGLLWTVEGPRSHNSAVQTYGVPSWSWASTKESIWFFASPPTQTYLQLHSWSVRPRSDRNRYGEIYHESGSVMPYVTVSGPTMPFVRRNKTFAPENEGPEQPTGEVKFDSRKGLEEDLFDDEFISLAIVHDVIGNPYMISQVPQNGREDQDAADDAPRRHLALAVGFRKNGGNGAADYVLGLILRESGDAFERVGTWVIDLWDEDWNQEGWENQTLKLV